MRKEYSKSSGLGFNLNSLYRIRNGISDKHVTNILSYLSGKKTAYETSLEPRDNDRLIRTSARAWGNLNKRADLVEQEIIDFEKTLAGNYSSEASQKREQFYKHILGALNIVRDHYKNSKSASTVQSLTEKVWNSYTQSQDFITRSVKPVAVPEISKSTILPEHTSYFVPDALENKVEVQTAQDIADYSKRTNYSEIRANRLSDYSFKPQENFFPVKDIPILHEKKSELQTRAPKAHKKQISQAEKNRQWKNRGLIAASVITLAAGAVKFGPNVAYPIYQAVSDAFEPTPAPSEYVSQSAIPPQRELVKVERSTGFQISSIMQSILNNPTPDYKHPFETDAIKPRVISFGVAPENPLDLITMIPSESDRLFGLQPFSLEQKGLFTVVDASADVDFITPLINNPVKQEIVKGQYISTISLEKPSFETSKFLTPYFQSNLSSSLEQVLTGFNISSEIKPIYP